MKRTFFQWLRDWWKNETSPEMRVSRTYQTEFLSGIGSRLHLSNHFPRYRCDFSEDLSSWLRPAFNEWREKCLKDFEKRTGVKITEPELLNEYARPIPPPRERPEE